MCCPDNVKNNILDMPIRGRMAFAITCFEGVLKKLNICTDKSKEILDWLWSYVSLKDISEWDEERDKNAPCSPGEVAPLAKVAVSQRLTRREIGDLIFKLLSEIENIGSNNLYTKFDNRYTLPHVLTIVDLMQNNGFQLPDMERFKMLDISDDREWGRAVPPCIFLPGYFGNLENTIIILKKDLHSSDVFVRRGAARAMQSLGPRDMEVDKALVLALRDPDAIVRKRAVYSIQCVDAEPKMVIPELVAALKDPNPEVRISAMGAIGSFKDQAREVVPSLVKAAKEAEPDIQYALIETIGKVGICSNEALDLLIAAFNDFHCSSKVRALSARVLSIFSSQSEMALNYVQRALKDADSEVVLSAICQLHDDLLRQLGQRSLSLVPGLVHILEYSQGQEQGEAVYVITQLGPIASDAVPALSKLLKKSTHPVFDVKLVNALASIGTKQAILAINNFTNHPDPRVREAVGDAIRSHGVMTQPNLVVEQPKDIENQSKKRRGWFW